MTVSDGALSASRSFTWVIKGSPATGTGTPEAGTSSLDPSADSPSLVDYVAVPGDFDGDGRLDLATYRRSSSEWRIWTSGSSFVTPTVMVWGEAGDRPMPADYNGDRVTDLGVYRPSTGTWHLWLSGTQTPLSLQWGGVDDVPSPLTTTATARPTSR